MVAYEEHREKRSVSISALLWGPLVGLAYVIFFPFIAIATIITLVGRKAAAGILGVLRNVVSFGWRPSEAYLAGKKKKKKKKEKGDG